MLIVLLESVWTKNYEAPAHSRRGFCSLLYSPHLIKKLRPKSEQTVEAFNADRKARFLLRTVATIPYPRIPCEKIPIRRENRSRARPSRCLRMHQKIFVLERLLCCVRLIRVAPEESPLLQHTQNKANQKLPR